MKHSAGVSRRLANGTKTVRRQGRVGFRSWANLFLSQGCPVCDRPTNQTFCLDCQRQLPFLEKASFQSWHQDDAHPLPVRALGIYGGTLKRAILAMKYCDRPEVAKPLGSALAQQWLNQPLPPQSSQFPQSSLYTVPIPLHAQRQRQRGYNQAELIARAFCQGSGLPLLANGLQRTQATLPQHQLSLSARQQNLSQAFQLGPSLNRVVQRQAHSPSVLLIDDIYTTGTTARSAAEILGQAGISVIGILAVARAVL